MDRIIEAIYADALAQDPSTSWICATRSTRRTGPIYTDFIHVNEDGNRLAAGRIAKSLNKSLNARPP